MRRTHVSVAGRRWLVAFTAALLLGTQTAPVRGDVSFSEPLAHVGEVRAGVPLVHHFAFVNQGPETVEVVQVRSSCGCLQPKVLPGGGPLPRVYPPGARGAVVVEVNTLGQAQGPHTWRTEVTYRRGDVVVEVPLLLSSKVVAEVVVQPAALTVVTGNAVGHEILLTDLRSRPLAITAVQATSPQLRSHVAAEYRDGEGHLVRRIRLEVTEDYPEGRHEEVLAILTDDPTYCDLRVPVTICKRSRQRLSAGPGAVTLFAPPGQPLPSRIVVIRDSGNEQVVVDRIVSDDPAITCQWAQGPNTSATVKVHVDRTRFSSDTLRSAIHVHVCKPLEETVSIPVTCTLEH